MNNDTTQPHNAFNGDGQPDQPTPRPRHDQITPQPIDSFRRPANSTPPPRPLHSTGAVRPRQDYDFSRRPAANQPAPQRPMPDQNFVSQPVPVSQQVAYGQKPGHEPDLRRPQQQAPTSQPVPAGPQPHHQAPPQNSIYPTATGGFAAAHQAPVQPNLNSDTKTSSVKQESIVTLVLIFGSFMVVMSALSLVTWISLGLNGSSEVIGLLLALGELILGVGILLRREIARFIYVIVGCILLIFSVFGTINYISQQSSSSNSNSPQMIGLQQAIQKYQNDNSISAAQRAKYIAVLEKSESVVQKQKATADNAGKVLVPLRNILIGYVLALAPIVFLTRPSVKKVFN